MTLLSINPAICWKLRVSRTTHRDVRPDVTIVKTCRVRTISRKGWTVAGACSRPPPSSDGRELVAVQNPQRLYAGQGRSAPKIQSELHGDMQSQAEMTWPPSSFNARE